MLPWLAVSEQKQVFPEGLTFSKPEDQVTIQSCTGAYASSGSKHAIPLPLPSAASEYQCMHNERPQAQHIPILCHALMKKAWQEKWVRSWVDKRVGFETKFEFKFYAARYDGEGFFSIFPVGESSGSALGSDGSCCDYQMSVVLL